MVLHFFNEACTIAACGLSAVAIAKHLKNYRKPLDQRLIVRILFMVPLFAISSFANLYCPYTFINNVLQFIREMYEAFVIYTFYCLLTNLLGGEREIIFTKTGDPPVLFFGLKLDISGPHTFWTIKKLIMQYVWMRPLVVLLSALLHHAPRSMFTRILEWVLFIAYNVSITIALNALMAFWVCLRTNLEPYCVVLKFLSVKMIVFFSYWQTLALRLIAHLGYISYESLPLWENSMLCIEAVLFAIVHWWAFPATDYQATFMFGFARMRLGSAIKDVVGMGDLVYDFKMTFLYPRYRPQDFHSVEAVLDHPDSSTRQTRLAAGLRYKNGGRSKYWLPDVSIRKMLITRSYGATNDGSAESVVEYVPENAESSEDSGENLLDMEDEYSEGEEELYAAASRTYGDYNYPVIMVQPSEEYVSFEDRLRRQRVLDG